MRWLAFVVVVAGCTVGDGSGKARRWTPPEVLPETRTGPSWLVQVTELRTSLGRAGVGLIMRGEQPVMESTACAESKRRCMRCQLLGESDALPSTALDEIVAAFARYPAQVLETSNIKHVVLCRKLAAGAKEMDGLADPAARVLFVSVNSLLEMRVGFDTGRLAETVHHEVFHLMDRNQVIDDEWHGLNASGFVYASREDQHARPEGFVNAYAATNPVEDRASVFQFLMSRPDELCALANSDPIVAAKTRLLWQRLGMVADLSFLRGSVACASAFEQR
jgi:hypothetical protein